MNIFSKKYRFFKRKCQEVQYSIWDLEFKISKSRQIREGVRQDRDRAVENLNKVEAAYKGETDEEKKKKLEEERNAHASNVSRYEQQMKMIDEQINGIPASGDNPGQSGLLDTLASLAELKKMYNDYASK